MKRLEQLPEIAEQSLGGLVAGQELKQRILESAGGSVRRSSRRAVWTPALCTALALVLVIGISVGIPAMRSNPGQEPLISTVAAGNTEVKQEVSRNDLDVNNVNVRSRGSVPDFRTLWQKGEDGAFPLIGVDGRYYRMMESPKSVSANILGNSIGKVAEFTTEPALARGDVTMSNVVANDTAVYPVSGMGGTLVAAEVDGKMRLFQRVSFNGNALLGKEGLSDTLQIAGHIMMMELSDVGVITDSAKAEELFATLVSNAHYESSGSVSGKQSLLIELDNGLTVQMLVKNDRLGACGVWSCPEFFEAFAEAVR